MPGLRLCDVCFNPLDGKRADARFCGDRCQKRADRAGLRKGESPAADALGALLDDVGLIRHASRIVPGPLGGSLAALADDLVRVLAAHVPQVVDFALATER